MHVADLIDADLRLSPFRDTDAPAFTQAARESVNSLAPWMPWCHDNYSKTEAQDWINHCRENASAGQAYEFGLFNIDRTLLLGGIGINEINTQNNYANLGYWVRSSQQNKGIATRAIPIIARFGFHTLKLTRLEILILVGNEASAKVALKAGAHFEGLIRHRLIQHGQPYDARLYSLLPQDVPSKR